MPLYQAGNNRIILGGHHAELYAKAKCFIDNTKSYKTAIVGNSRGMSLVNPETQEKRAVNLCTPSQDTYYTYNLIKKLANYSSNNMEVLFILSDSSLTFDACLSRSEVRHTQPMKNILEIQPYYKGNNESKATTAEKAKNFFADKIAGRRIILPEEIAKRVNGYNPMYKALGCMPLKSQMAAERIMKLRRAFSGKYTSHMGHWIEKINTFCALRKIRIRAVFPPYRSDYRMHIPSQTINTIFDLLPHADQRINLIDKFKDEYFLDPDHLRPCEYVDREFVKTTTT